MAAEQIVPGLYMFSTRAVNMFLIESPAGCTLIDTGLPGSAPNLLQELAAIGKQSRDIRHIILTHAHPDHIGSFAALKRETNARAYMHRLDTGIATAGRGFRPMTPAPGLRRRILFRLFVHLDTSVEGEMIDQSLEDGDRLDFADDLQVIHTPGHCAGQVCLLWRKNGGVLLAADACSNMGGLGWSLGYEDVEEGKRSLKKLSSLNFQSACFGHGKPIREHASVQFAKKWG